MNPFQPKYNHLTGTHCWYCDREFSSEVIKTKDHIIPLSKMPFNYEKNYIAACKKCNAMKGCRDAKHFAQNISGYGRHRLIRQRAWKLYNKTSKLHREYKSIQINPTNNRTFISSSTALR